MFGITADHIVDSFEPGLDLATMSSRVILGSSSVIEQVRPDVLVVQGDTTSACMAGLAAFYQGVPVVHLEAGLRTGDLRNPFPEEANRAILGRLAELHLAPTRSAKENLLREGVPEEAIRVIGNTVIDALYQVLENQPPIRDASLRALLASVPSGSGHRLITVTTHRRESWGEPMQRVFSAVSRLAMRHMDCDFIVPLHPNPTVRDA